MREIHVDVIRDAVAEQCINANRGIRADARVAMKQAITMELSPVGRSIIGQLVKNDELSRERSMAYCQDTGITVVFVQLGQDVHVVGGDLKDAINQGVARGYTEGYLRKSIAADPLFDRKNTGDNTPAMIYIDVVPGDKIKLDVAPKGGGSENMGQTLILTPAEGVPGVKKFVLDTCIRAGANACPPFAIVGVGIGGTLEMSALLSKKALLRPVGQPHPDPRYAALEREMLNEINQTGIGPAGLGGTVTALACHIEHAPTHITSLPVAVNVLCNAARHAEVEI